MIDTVLNLFICLMVAMSIFGAIVSVISTIQLNRNKDRPLRTVSSDGHIVKKEEDLTCARFGHKHDKMPEEFGERYVVHNDPQTGEVVIDGVKRKIKDCTDI